MGLGLRWLARWLGLRWWLGLPAVLDVAAAAGATAAWAGGRVALRPVPRSARCWRPLTTTIPFSLNVFITIRNAYNQPPRISPCYIASCCLLIVSLGNRSRQGIAVTHPIPRVEHGAGLTSPSRTLSLV